MDPPRPSVAFERALRRMRARRTRAVVAGVLLCLALATVAVAAGTDLFRASKGPQAVTAVAVPEDQNGNGVPDAFENAVFGLDPSNASAAPSTLPLRWIQVHGLDVSDPLLASRAGPYPTRPASPPVYGDGGLPPEFRMTLGDIYSYGRPATWNESRDGAFDSRLDPRASDVNASGVPYGWLIYYKLDPFDAGLLDRHLNDLDRSVRESYARGLSPISVDGDGDGLPDDVEIAMGTNPRAYSTTGSGIADGWLVCHGFDPLDPAVPYQDADKDGLTNLDEFRASMRLFPNATLPPACAGLDPKKSSTAGSPIPDGWLVKYGLDPLDPAIASRVVQEETRNSSAGADVLRLTVLDKYVVNRPPLWSEPRDGPWWGGADPTKNDTDGDGLSDITEIVGWNVTVDGVARHVRSDPTKMDTDLDGLTDREEFLGVAGNVTFPPTDPSSADTDADGLTDAQEVGLAPYRGASLPRLDPTLSDTDRDGLSDGAEVDYWNARAAACEAQATYAWGKEPRRTVAQSLATNATPFDCARLLPGGSVLGTGTPNVLNPDSDGDGLLDGWEVRPELYASTPYAWPHPRPATDPANKDTDGDTLPDGWEMKFGSFDARLGGSDLDPSKWSSFLDSSSDAEHDLDNDSITWYSYDAVASGLVAVPHEFRATNGVEYAAGSDPHRASSSPDGILDGWKIFWGRDYLGLSTEQRGAVYPGAPGELALPPGARIPRIGADDNVVLSELSYRRYHSGADATLLPGETVTKAFNSFTDAKGAVSSFVQISGHAVLDYRGAQENRTNPYLADTDGDGMPDVWETIWSRVPATGVRVSPVVPDASLDGDGDGLDAHAEYVAGCDPGSADSDHGGVDDATEVRAGLSCADPNDDRIVLDSTTDSDGDGIHDSEEVLGRDVAGRRVVTNPLDPDTDHDGLLDGPSLSKILHHTPQRSDPADAAILARLQARGLIVVPSGAGVDIIGEEDSGSDPTLTSTAGDGIPDGWKVLHLLSPTDRFPGLLAAYSWGRPAWWNESEDGIWRWGFSPGEPTTRDHDLDGLDDFNGEDPFPFTDRLNVGTAPAPGPDASPLARLEWAQRYGNLTDPSPVPFRPQTIVTLDNLTFNDTGLLAANGSAWFTGNVTKLDGGGPVANATVVLSSGSDDLVLGVAITNASGAFNGTVTLARTVAAPSGSGGHVVFGALDGKGAHANPAAAFERLVTSGPVQVFAWSYNSTKLLGNASASHTIRWTLEPRLRLTVDGAPIQGATVHVNATLTDPLDRPIEGARLKLLPEGPAVLTDAQGAASWDVVLPTVPGALDVNVTFAGMAPYVSANATARVHVLSRTILTVSGPPGAVHAGDPFTILARLQDADLSGIRDAPVEIRRDGSREDARTNASGGLRSVLRLSDNATPGDQVVDLAFPGNATQAPASASLTIRVQGAPRWETSDVVAQLGAPANVTARLVDRAGASLSFRTIALEGTLGGALSGATDRDGRVVLQLSSAGAEPGEQTLVLSFQDPLDGVARTPLHVTWTTGTRTTLVAAPLVRGSSSILEGTLHRTDGQAVAAQPVDVTVVGRTFAAVTSANGSFRVVVPVPSTLSTGATTAIARYAGTPDDVFASSTGAADVDVVDQARIDLDGATILRTHPVVTGRLVDLTGRAIAGREVRLSVAGEERATTTGDDGSFNLRLPAAATRALGPFTAGLVVDDDRFLLGVSQDATFALKDKGTLLVEAPAAVEDRSLPLKLSLVDSTSAPSAIASLNVSIDGVPVPATTGKSVPLPATLALGRHHLTVEAGSPTVQAPAVTKDFDLRETSSLVLERSVAPNAQDAGELQVRLRNAHGPLANRTLFVSGVAGVPVRIDTDGAGVASIVLPRDARTQGAYAVYFPGDASQGVSTLSVKTAPTAPPAAASIAWEIALAALAALALLAIGARWWRRRRRALSDVLSTAARRLRHDRADVKAIYRTYLDLLALHGMDEAGTDPLTFRDLLSAIATQSPSTQDAADRLQRVFDLAVYAPHLIEPSTLDEAATCFERLSAAARQTESHSGVTS